MFIASVTMDGDDHYSLHDTYAEAKAEIGLTLKQTDLYCWAISEVVEASEPHWTDTFEEESA